jgi:hypothetical protein
LVNRLTIFCFIGRFVNTDYTDGKHHEETTVLLPASNQLDPRTFKAPIIVLEAVLYYAAAEHGSEHPGQGHSRQGGGVWIEKSIAAGPAEGFHSETGRGILCTVDGRNIHLGNLHVPKVKPG